MPYGRVYAEKPDPKSHDEYPDLYEYSDHEKMEAAEETKEGLDEILDEIDALLSENEVEMAAAYRQHGGE